MIIPRTVHYSHKSNASPYAEAMYQSWLKDPNSVHSSWKHSFETLGWERTSAIVGEGTNSTAILFNEENALDAFRIDRLVRAYQVCL